MGKDYKSNAEGEKKYLNQKLTVGTQYTTPQRISGGCIANISRISWGARIRTSTYGFRVRCPTVRRLPNE